VSTDRAHILVRSTDMSVQCTHCARRLVLPLPLELDVWIAASEAFAELHASCPAPVMASGSSAPA
jgi:hypothetical protein